MRYTIIILLLLAITSHGQTTLADQQDKKRLEIEKRLTSDKNKLIVLVKVNGQTDLQKVVGENWPANIETTYNILKSQGGQIIYIGEFPTSESGDWTLGLKHYFSDNGKLIAFEKRLSYFNDDCTDGAVIEKQIELYDKEGFDSGADLSPDGKKIAFYGPSDKGNYDIFVLSMDGADVVNLTNDEMEDYSPSWSPDGNWISFTSGNSANYDIWKMNIYTKEKIRLTTQPERDETPYYQPR